MVALEKKQNAVYPKPLLGKPQKNCTWYRDITDVYYCPCRWAGTNICLGALFLFNKTNKLYTPISNRCYKQLKLKRKTLHCSGWGTFICCFKGLAMKSLISNWKHGNILNHRAAHGFSSVQAKFAFQMSKFSQTCLFLQGRSQNIILYEYMKHVISQSSSRMYFWACKEKERKAENNQQNLSKNLR